MGTQKLFTFTVGDGNFTNVNLNFESCIEFVRRCDFSGFAFRRLSVNDLNNIFEIFSRSCNTLFRECYHLRSLQYRHRKKI